MQTFELLGPIEARSAGAALDLGGPRERAVLARLALQQTVGLGTADGEVTRLRDALGVETIVSGPEGYELRADPEQIDVVRFERLADAGRDRLAARELQGAADALDAALALWRGEPFGELAGEAWAAPEVARLAERRIAAVEDRMDAALGLGHDADLIGELELLVIRHPARERLREQLMLALYRAGRRAEALAVYRDAPEPGAGLRSLEQSILRRDPQLELRRAGERLVGRDRVLARLQETLDRALAGSGRLVVLTGEPGIGKTFLAQELALRAAADGAAVVWGRCWEAGGAPPFWPWTQVLRTYLGAVDLEILRARLGPRLPFLAANLPWLAELLPELGPTSLPEDRFAIFSAAAELIATEARQRPLAIFLDDLHAADEPSLLLLRYLADAVDGWPVLLVAMSREEIPGPAHLRVEVEGLDEAAVAELVDAHDRARAVRGPRAHGAGRDGRQPAVRRRDGAAARLRAGARRAAARGRARRHRAAPAHA